MAGKIENLFVASRFVLPEQRAGYLQMQVDKKLVQQPMLEDDALEQMSYRIHDSIQYDYSITVEWFVPKKGEIGEIESAWGWVKRVDDAYKQIKLVNDEVFHWIDIERIVRIIK